MYKTATMVHDYLALGSEASESELISYMKANKESPCYDQASDRVALLKMEKLKIDANDRNKTMNNLRSDYWAAADYAVSSATKEELESVRSFSYSKKRNWNNAIYGPKVTIGIGINGAFSQNVFNLGIGVYARFGRFNQILNGTIGLKYELVKQYGGSSNNSSSVVAHSAILPVGLRLNIIKLSDKWRMYIGGKTEFGFNFEGNLLNQNTEEKIGQVMKKNTISFYPEIGFQSRRWDFSLYYKIYNGNPYMSDGENNNIPYVNEKTLNSKQFGGVNLTVYF